MNTIIQCTDNSLDPQLAEVCRRVLLREAGDQPIISVSQKPISAFGENIVVGEIGRSWISYYKQMLAGCEAAPTDIIVMTEHDCMYTHEHLTWEIEDTSVFWYNSNCWLTEGPGGNHTELFGLYSYWPRRLAMSQLICDKRLLIAAITERLNILSTGGTMDRNFLGYGEPGVISERALAMVRQYADSGQPVRLEPYLKDYLTRYEHKVFTTVNPNLDIRHGSNFSGPKRGKKRTYSLPYWGKFADVMKER